jgi:hypothetical protein
MKFSSFSRTIITQVAFFVLALAGSSKQCLAAPSFASTSDPSKWTVATNVGGTDGQFSSFPITGFAPATAIASRADWIANNDTGTNGGMETWTFFVFSQTFDLTGYDPTTADLKFQWAADDSGEIFASRGSWIPKLSLNGGDLINYPGSTSGSRIATYGYSSTVDLASGFVPGLNTIKFYVEGNGVTDGFSLKTGSFTADNVVVTPEPASMVLFGVGGAALAFMRRRKA